MFPPKEIAQYEPESVCAAQPESHIKSHSSTYSSTVLHTGIQNKAQHTAQEDPPDMLFLFLSKIETKGQEKAYLLNVRKRIQQTREQKKMHKEVTTGK